MVKNFYDILQLPVTARQQEVDWAIDQVKIQNEVSFADVTLLKKIMRRPKARGAYDAAISASDYKKVFSIKEAQTSVLDSMDMIYLQGPKAKAGVAEDNFHFSKPVCLFLFFVLSFFLFFYPGKSTKSESSSVAQPAVEQSVGAPQRSESQNVKLNVTDGSKIPVENTAKKIERIVQDKKQSQAEHPLREQKKAADPQIRDQIF